MSEDKEVFEGVVDWFDSKMGFGFLNWEKDKVKQKDMFCHYSDINMTGFKILKAGQRVSFSIGKNNSGDDKAIDVKVIE